VSYKKIRGKGLDAPETNTGADGVFQIEVQLLDGALLVVHKGILFQAKKYKGSSRSDLIDQVENMEQFAPGGSALFEFGPEGYRGAAGRVILTDSERNPRRIPHPDEPLGSFLADQFLPCGAGLRGMYYDFADETLFVPHEGIVRRVSLRHLIEVKVRRRKRKR
jgi:hypothetical protein